MSKDQTPPNPFGRRISKADAQRMYKNFYKIKKRALDKFRDPFADDTEALRYHGGLYDEQPAAKGASASEPKQYNCCFLDMAFVFDAETLQDLLKQENKDKKKPQGIAIFLGTRDKEDSLADEIDEYGNVVMDAQGNPVQGYCDVDGRPTLLVFPFVYEDYAEPDWTDKKVANIILALNDGLEHPGTGGGGTGGGGTTDAAIQQITAGVQPGDVNLPIPSELPGTYPVQSIHHYQFGARKKG